MKKTVAVFIALFVISMGTMVGWGFVEKQQKENTPAPVTSDPSMAPVASAKAYSIAEVAQHSSQKDCWVAINGFVYDVTSYLNLHPGGADLILTVCGKDATQAYATQGGRGSSHPPKADQQLANFKIGELKR